MPGTHDVTALVQRELPVLVELLGPLDEQQGEGTKLVTAYRRLYGVHA
jgi:hypothetical protein